MSVSYKLNNENSLGTDSFNWVKFGFFFFIVFLVVLVLPFFTINITDEAKKVQAQWYITYLGYGFILVFIIDLVLGFSKKFAKIPEIIDVVVYEKKTAFGVFSNFNVLLFFAGLIILFFSLIAFISFKGSAFITAPTYQLIHLGAFGGAFLTFCFQMLEELIFVGFVAPSVYAITYLLTKKNKTLALVVMFLLSPLIFAIYHFGRYGTTDMVGTIFVFVLNFTGVLFLYIFRNVFVGIAIHGANNIGVQLLQESKIDPIIIFIMCFFVLVFLIMLFFLYFKSKTRKNLYGVNAMGRG